MSFDKYERMFSQSINHGSMPKYLGLNIEELELLVLKKRTELRIIRFVNQLLLLGIIGCVGFVCIQGVRGLPQKYQERIAELEDIANLSREQKRRGMPKVSHLSEYQNRLRERNLFHPVENKVAKKTVNSQAATDFLRKKIKIVGIMMDGDPMVVIEDIRSKSTSFVTAGASVQGAVVKEIFADKVIFSFKGTLIEILQ